MSAGEPMRGGGAQEGQVAATADGVAVAAGAPGAAAAVDAAAAPPERPRRPPPEEDANFKFHNMPHPARPEHLVKEAEVRMAWSWWRGRACTAGCPVCARM